MKLHLRAMGVWGTNCHVGSKTTQVNTPRLNPSQRPVLDLSTPEGWKAEFYSVQETYTSRECIAPITSCEGVWIDRQSTVLLSHVALAVNKIVYYSHGWNHLWPRLGCYLSVDWSRSRGTRRRSAIGRRWSFPELCLRPPRTGRCTQPTCVRKHRKHHRVHRESKNRITTSTFKCSPNIDRL